MLITTDQNISSLRSPKIASFALYIYIKYMFFMQDTRHRRRKIVGKRCGEGLQKIYTESDRQKTWSRREEARSRSTTKALFRRAQREVSTYTSTQYSYILFTVYITQMRTLFAATCCLFCKYIFLFYVNTMVTKGLRLYHWSDVCICLQLRPTISLFFFGFVLKGQVT